MIKKIDISFVSKFCAQESTQTFEKEKFESIGKVHVEPPNDKYVNQWIKTGMDLD